MLLKRCNEVKHKVSYANTLKLVEKHVCICLYHTYIQERIVFYSVVQFKGLFSPLY